MAWGVGANDVANAMGTSVGSKALTDQAGDFIAMIFEFAGAYLAGGEVTSTIRKGIVDSAIFRIARRSSFWHVISTAGRGHLADDRQLYGLAGLDHPLHCGRIVGFAAVGVSCDAVNWGKVGTIVCQLGGLAESWPEPCHLRSSAVCSI